MVAIALKSFNSAELLITSTRKCVVEVKVMEFPHS